jgi:toxin ParE1/3/4
MPSYSVSPQAEADVVAVACYIAESNADAGERFVDAAYATFRFLTTQPELGRPRRFPNSALTGLRSWRVAQFTRYLIFYRYQDGIVEILRVIHGARDLDALFRDVADT